MKNTINKAYYDILFLNSKEHKENENLQKF